MRFDELPPHIQKNIKGVRIISARPLGKLKKGINGRYLCRWCLGETKPPRRTWCSDECVSKFESLYYVVRNQYSRDKGICQICHIKVSTLQDILIDGSRLYRQVKILYSKQQYNRLVEKDKVYLDKALAELGALAEKYPDLFTTKKRKSLKSYEIHLDNVPRPKKTHAHEIDHIVPVCRGGTTTSCNLRLLCILCHAKVTSELLKENK